MFLKCILLYMTFVLISIMVIPKLKHKDKLTKFIVIVLFSLLFTFINIFCTKNSINMGSDRYNYMLSFLGIKSTSVGLSYIFLFIKLFSNNINTVFYFTTFLACFAIFWSFYKNNDADKNTLLFILLTDIIFFSFTGLKQIYTSWLIFIIFSIYFSSNKKYKHLINFILIFISCLFHTTGYIMIPIYITLMLYENKEIKINKYMFLVILFLAFFEPILLFIARSFLSIFPTLVSKILNYFGETSVHIDDGNSIFSFIKGFPFYIISFVGIFNSNKIKSKTKNYDKYLFLSIIGSVLYLCSIFSYWFHRFTILFYFPIGILFSILLKNLDNGKNKLLLLILVYGSEIVILFRWLYLIFANYGGF